ncbi:MAG TPA: extensin family protein [Devosia sp.]|nr:extensin family protein [Devosia sp.]
MLPMLALLALSLPAAGQDIFQPLREMVEGLQQPQTPVAPRRNVPKTPVPLPQERPKTVPEQPAPVAEEVSEPDVVLPRPRPEAPEAETVPEAAPKAESAAPASEPIFQTACPALLAGQVEAKALPPLSDGQCQAQSPLSVTGVMANGRRIPFSGEAITDCGMATALPGWIAAVDLYVQAHDDTKIESVLIGTSYMCRNVNNAEAGNLSFHGFADALDVVGFTLADGRSVTVEQGWTGSAAQGSVIVKFAHDAACGQFTTTLGPDANALHHDHIHIDLGCHGKSCSARLCE